MGLSTYCCPDPKDWALVSAQPQGFKGRVSVCTQWEGRVPHRTPGLQLMSYRRCGVCKQMQCQVALPPEWRKAVSRSTPLADIHTPATVSRLHILSSLGAPKPGACASLAVPMPHGFQVCLSTCWLTGLCTAAAAAAVCLSLFCSLVQFSQKKADGQVRWSVLNVAALLRRHTALHDNLAAAMASGASVGACVQLIEDALSKPEADDAIMSADSS